MDYIDFSDLLNLLMNHCRKENGRPYSLAELSRGTGISGNQLGMYRRHQHNNPTLESIRSILDFFQMPIAILESRTQSEALAMITAVQNGQKIHHPSQAIANALPRETEPSDEGMEQMKALVDWVIRRERALLNGEEEPVPPDFS